MDVSRKARFDGVFNGVQGDKEAVDALIEHPDPTSRARNS